MEKYTGQPAPSVSDSSVPKYPVKDQVSLTLNPLALKK